MSIWQQHYYTWSTNSLSQNKVGLGIVAASKDDRDSIRIAENFGAKSEVLREETVTIERGSFNPEIPGYVRTGVTPCGQGADQRNNKFVHIYSAKMEELKIPEEYLGEISYEREWNGEKTLKPLSFNVKSEGRAYALRILKKYHLESRLEELFHAVYHCLLTGEKPLTIVDGKRNPGDFGEFSREMMILIHYMIPVYLRKEADYVSYVSESSQEAHFLFGKEAGKYSFYMNRANEKKLYVLLEKEFYDMLAKAFVKPHGDFEKLMNQMEDILLGLMDKRNQLDKCIFAFMASLVGKEKKKEDYFLSLERLMYWARKDKILIPAIEEATKDLDFHGMQEEELLSYTKLMLTGAGGETKEMALLELNRMACYYEEKKDHRFGLLLDFIRENNARAYEQILLKNEDGFAKDILYAPIENKATLEKALLYHKGFLAKDKYRTFVVKSAYDLYKREKGASTQEQIADLGKKADEAMFVGLKQKDVEKVLKTAENLNEYLNVVGQMAVENFEQPIKEMIFKYAVCHKKESVGFTRAEEEAMLSLGVRLDLSEKMAGELGKYYIYKLKEVKDVTALDTQAWIRYVLYLSSAIDRIDKKKATEVIKATKNAILKSGDIYLLARANMVLKNHGTPGIHCPKSMWDMLPLQKEEDFKALYDNIPELSYVKCEKSEKYKLAEELYELAEECKSGDKASYAWYEYERLEKKVEEYEMEERGVKKLLQCAAEDITSKTIWAVLFGMYGFFFISLREMLQFMPGYILSIGALVLLVISYGVSTMLGERRQTTPGAIIYVLGVGIFLMNLSLSFDTVMSVVILFVVSIIAAVGLRILYRVMMDEKDG